MQIYEIIDFILLSLIPFIGYSQSYLKDNQTKEIIPEAYILNKKGQLIGKSNQEGKISLFSSFRHYTDSLVIKHIAYKPFHSTGKKLQNIKILFLEQRINKLPEITISTDYDYTIIKGYFRSYQINDLTPVYYADGIIEYYIPKKEKKKIKYRLLNNRSFKNNKYLENEIKRSITLSTKTAGIFNYAYYWLPYRKSDYFFEKLTTQRDTIIIKNNDKENSGKALIDRKNNRTIIFYDCLYPKKEKKNSLFGYTSIIKHMIFSELLNTSNINNSRISQMASCKMFRQIDFKYKKEKNFTRIDAIDEFYTLEIRRIRKKNINKKELLSSYTLIPTQNKEDMEWLKDYNEKIPPLEKSIQKQFGKQLILF